MYVAAQSLGPGAHIYMSPVRNIESMKQEINYLAAELRGIKTASAVVSEFFYTHPFCPVTEHRPV